MPTGERFRDADYQRWSQSFRTRESLSRAGKAGYNATVAKYGAEFLHDRAADRRRERSVPQSRLERGVVELLRELGQREDRSEHGGPRGDYYREHKLAPRRHAGFAWPGGGKAIAAWGGVHTDRYFIRQERVAEGNRRQLERARAAGWDVLVVTTDDLRREDREGTRERIGAFLGLPADRET